MRLNTFEDEDVKELLDSLKAEAMELDPTLTFGGPGRLTVADVHRRFHHRVVRWLREQGWKP